VIYALDSDMNGDDSIRRFIKAGTVQHMPVPTYGDFEHIVMDLIPKIKRGQDIVVVDTLGCLAETTRGDAKLGTNPQDDLWSKRALYLGGDKNYLTVYSLAGDLIMRRLKNLRAAGARIITTSHEDDVIDPATNTKKIGPKLNPAFYESLMHATSDVVRLIQNPEDKLNEEGEVVLPAGARALQLRPSESAIAKFHVDDPERALTMPRMLRMPLKGGLHVLNSTYDKEPSWLHIYGVPGAGKTSLAVSEAEAPTPV
jgi:hypothetical protein